MDAAAVKTSSQLERNPLHLGIGTDLSTSTTNANHQAGQGSRVREYLEEQSITF